MRFSKLIASGVGTGYAPLAPGTAGSLLGIIVLYMLNFVLYKIDVQQPLVLVLNLIVIVGFLFLGVYAIKNVHKEWAHDASKIVIDEIVGVWIAAYAVPFHWKYFLSAFILFRFFDIYKPMFIRKIDRMKGDWSVMVDDVVAGVYAAIVLQLIMYFRIF